jgi:small subunit ribosomal protein S14
MARKAVIQRESKRKRLTEQYLEKRRTLKKALKVAWAGGDIEEVMSLQVKLQSLPRNSAPTRQRARCALTGRARGVERKFGICRNKLRKFMGEGFVPGLVMASW